MFGPFAVSPVHTSGSTLRKPRLTEVSTSAGVRLGDRLVARYNSPTMEVHLYQIAGDDMFRGHRPGGTGWEWSWAEWRRDWMDATQNKFAYRCLPLTMANQTGWWVYNPVGFTAMWDGRAGPRGIAFQFDSEPDLWFQWINNQFGHGIITWNTPFLFRTAPAGTRLLVTGPLNFFKHGAQPLTAIVETDWMNMSFTMNWKLTEPDVPVRFELGEPLFQAIPIGGDLFADLEGATVTYQRLTDAPEIAAAYAKWSESRRKFHEQKAAGEVKADDWQKDYFTGRDVMGRQVASGHKTKLVPPVVKYNGPRP